jgi:hypothetical protein
MRTVSGGLGRSPLLVASLLFSALVACATGAAKAPAPERSTIEFQNETLEPADVFVLSGGGSSTRLGTVMPGRTDTITVPHSIMVRATNVSVVARLRRLSRVVSSGSLVLHPGEQLSLRLPVDARMIIVLP